MTAYVFEVGCGQCGGDVRHVNGTPGTAVFTTAVCQCVDCGRQWEVYVTMRHHAKNPDAAQAMRVANAKRSTRQREVEAA